MRIHIPYLNTATLYVHTQVNTALLLITYAIRQSYKYTKYKKVSKVTAQDHERQFPVVLCEGGSKPKENKKNLQTFGLKLMKELMTSMSIFSAP